MSQKYIVLWLEAPMQSWGADSRFGRRDTLGFPTKSGILGLLCCALGAGGEQQEFLAEMAPLRQTVLAFTQNRSTNASYWGLDKMPPLLRDFQMVGSGYNDADPWETMMIPKKSDGGKAVGGGSKITYRYYLQQAFFAVVLEVPAERTDAFTHALQFPSWDLYLGRKCCVPTDIIYRGCFDIEIKALEQVKFISESKSLTEEFRVLDGEHDGETIAINDVPLQFGPVKRYRERLVTIIYNTDDQQ